MYIEYDVLAFLGLLLSSLTAASFEAVANVDLKYVLKFGHLGYYLSSFVVRM